MPLVYKATCTVTQKVSKSTIERIKAGKGWTNVQPRETQIKGAL